MATSTPLPSRSPEETDNPGQEEFDKLIEQQFSPGDELMMEERAKAGADEDMSSEETTENSPTQEEIAAAEATGGEKKSKAYENQVGKGYQKHTQQIGFVRRQLGRRNRLFLIGGAGTMIVVIAIVIFLSLLPFKILHIVNNLQNHFFSTSENAMSKETNALFSNYLKKYVMPALKNCPTSVDRSCNPITQGSLVSQLYKGWRNAHLEEKLSSPPYNIEFRFNKLSGHYYLRMPNLTGDGVDLGTETSGFEKSSLDLDDYINKLNDPVNDTQFKRVTRSQLRAAVNDALSKSTNNRSMMFRFKVGRMLEKKYGFKRCIFACDTRDNFADWKDNKFRAAKLILAERVLAPRSESLALVISCILTDSCDPSHRTEAGGGPEGEPQSKFERELQAKLDALALEETGKYADVLAHSSGILKDGYAKYLAKKVAVALVDKFGGSEATAATAEQVSSDLIPVIGWINAASTDVGMLEHAGPTIKALSYMTNASAMVATYGTYRTYADEVKSGNVDAALMGSMTDSLGAGTNDSDGGPASAEQSPLYQYLIGGDVNSGGQKKALLFNGQANAASTPVYGCTDGKSVQAGKLICQNEVLAGQDSQLVSGINDLLNAIGPLKNLADFWNNSVGFVMKKIINGFAYITSPALKALTDFTHLNDLISAAIQPIINAFTDYLIPNPFSDNSAGGHKFVEAAGGADQLNSDFTQNGLGGKKLTTLQAAVILAEQNEQDLQTYKNQSLLARVTDTDSQYSLANRLAMSLPDSTKSASQSISTALFTNPFSKISSLFSPLLSLGHAKAVSNFPDPFGIPQYGYPDDDPGLAAANADPEAYWSKNCSSDGQTLDWNVGVNADWINSATVDPDTGLPEYDTTNPCMLIQAAVGSTGGIFDSNLLTADDLGDNTTPATTDTSTTTAGTSFDTGPLFNDSTSVACAAGTNDLGIQDGYHNGQLVKIRICAIPNLPSTSEESNGGYGISGANGKAIVNSRVSGAVLAMVQAAAKGGVTLAANSSFRTMEHQQALCAANALCASGNYTYVAKPGTSNHQMGLAIDFSTLPATPGPVPGNPVWDWLSKNAAIFGYKNYPAEAWHWSPTGN
jgi:hypothetical protein